jgi:hypothetical protein
VSSASAHGTVGVIDDDAPVVGLGSKGVRVSAGTMGFGVGTWPIGLTPPTPSSVEPMGIPMRPGAVPVGDDDDAAGFPATVPMPAQVPDGVPVTMPPPSKSEPVPALGIPFIPPLKLLSCEFINIDLTFAARRNRSEAFTHFVSARALLRHTRRWPKSLSDIGCPASDVRFDRPIRGFRPKASA